MLTFLFLALAIAQTPREVTEPVLVRIDAVASDVRGRVVDNLRAEDFVVTQDGTTLTVESVRFVRTGTNLAAVEAPTPIVSRADEQAAAMEDGVRLFAIFLDEYHVTSGRAADIARETMTRFVNEAIGPRDLVLIVKPLDSLLNLRLTRDRQKVLRTIETIEGRKGQYTPANSFERELFAGTPQRIEAVRAQIATSALNALATHLSGLGSARKTIVFVSEGFGRGPRRRGDEALPSIDSVIRTARRADIIVYPFDPGDSAADSAAARDTLRALAEQTDGRMIAGDSDPTMLARLVGEQTAYYLVEFRSTEIAADGKFHPVDVRVRRPDVRVRARPGFWAPTADEISRARLLAKSLEPKPPPEPPRHISPLIRPWFGQARGAGGATQVSFVWEPAGRVPGDRLPLPVAAKVTLKALKPDGSTVFEGIVRPSAPGAETVSGLEPMRAVFDAAPGRLRLQMQIEDAAARVVDTDVRDLVVGALGAPVQLGTAAIIRARNAREYRSAAASVGAVPTSAREFSRREQLLIRVPAYAPDGPTVWATLVNKQGSAMRPLDVTSGPAPNLYQIDLPLAGLASGSYVVQLGAKSSAGEANDEILFRVTP